MNLETYTVPELKAMAKVQGLSGYSKLTKDELIERLERAQGKALWAAPKSTAIKEFAKENELEFIDMSMTQIDDSDMLGIPATGGTDFTVARISDDVSVPPPVIGDTCVTIPKDTVILAKGICSPEEQLLPIKPRFIHYSFNFKR